MKKEITYLYPATQDSVRIQKFAKFFAQRNYVQRFIGWKRYRDKEYVDDKFVSINYLVKGGGDGNRILPFLYLLFMLKLFFVLLFNSKWTRDKIVIAINLETAFVVYLVSHFRRVYFIYDIWDELAISHTFPPIVVKFIKNLDNKVRKRSSLYIHVDDNRISEIDSSNKNYVIIYNSPYDYMDRNQSNNHENAFAVTGWLNNTRGLSSILKFAKDNSLIKFYIVGEFIDDSMKTSFLKLKNIEYHHLMPQEALFSLISQVRGIFSLYDPSIEINRLAASNKLYDAMMLGIPVIVNSGIGAAQMVESEQIGYVVNYEYDMTWNILSDFDEKKVTKLGNNGRNIYMERFEFSNMMETKLYPILATKADEI